MIIKYIILTNKILMSSTNQPTKLHKLQNYYH